MQQTTKYKFDLIDTSDAFSPEKLNDNAQKLEDALNQHESSVSAALAQHKSDVSVALTQHKSDVSVSLGTKADQTALDALSKTVTANKTAADNALAKHETAETARVNAVQESVKFVKLGEAATKQTGEAMTFNLSSIKLADYAAFWFLLGGTAVSGVNGSFYLQINEQSKMAIFNVNNVTAAGHFTVFQANGYIMGLATCRTSSNSSTPYSTSDIMTLDWNSITSFRIVCNNIQAGAYAILYGIKK